MKPITTLPQVNPTLDTIKAHIKSHLPSSLRIGLHVVPLLTLGNEAMREVIHEVYPKDADKDDLMGMYVSGPCPTIYLNLDQLLQVEDTQLLEFRATLFHECLEAVGGLFGLEFHEGWGESIVRVLEQEFFRILLMEKGLKEFLFCDPKWDVTVEA